MRSIPIVLVHITLSPKFELQCMAGIMVMSCATSLCEKIQTLFIFCAILENKTQSNEYSFYEQMRKSAIFSHIPVK